MGPWPIRRLNAAIGTRYAAFHLLFNKIKGLPMKLSSAIILIAALTLPCLSACNMKSDPEKANPDSSVGKMSLEVAAENSDRAKEVEAAVKAAADKANANLEAAVKEANQGE